MPAIIGYILLAGILFSCDKPETKEEYLQRAFFEEHHNSSRFKILAAKSRDMDTIMAYLDSSSMAAYSAHQIYLEMYPNYRTAQIHN